MANYLTKDHRGLEDVFADFYKNFFDFGDGFESVLLVAMEEFDDYLAYVVAQDEVLEKVGHLVDVAVCFVLMQLVFGDVV